MDFGHSPAHLKQQNRLLRGLECQHRTRIRPDILFACEESANFTAVDQVQEQGSARGCSAPVDVAATLARWSHYQLGTVPSHGGLLKGLYLLVRQLRIVLLRRHPSTLHGQELRGLREQAENPLERKASSRIRKAPPLLDRQKCPENNHQ